MALNYHNFFSRAHSPPRLHPLNETIIRVRRHRTCITHIRWIITARGETDDKGGKSVVSSARFRAHQLDSRKLFKAEQFVLAT